MDIQKRNFPDLIEAYLSYTAGHESTVRIRKWCIISVMAAALERRVWIPRGYYTLFPNLYTFIIGKSGFVKKSTSTAIAVNMLREVPGIKIMSERLTAASLISQLAKAGKKFEYDGDKVNQSPVFSYASELSVFLQEVFGSITELLTTFYDCVPSDSSKPWVHNTMGRGEDKIYGPCLNILGGSTRSWLKKCIPSSEMEGGFTSRIIFVVENKLPENLVAWPSMDTSGEKLRYHIIQDLKQINSIVGEYIVKDDAREMFKKWYTHHMRKVLPKNQDPRMVGYMSRKGDTILKLSMTRAASQRNALIVTKDDIKWASTEIDDLEKDWLMAFEGFGNFDSLQYELMEVIKKKQSMSLESLYELFGQRFPKAEIVKELNEITEKDEAIVTEVIQYGQPIKMISHPGFEPRY